MEHGNQDHMGMLDDTFSTSQGPSNNSVAGLAKDGDGLTVPGLDGSLESSVYASPSRGLTKGFNVQCSNVKSEYAKSKSPALTKMMQVCNHMILG